MNTRKKSTKEFKLDAISLVLDQGYTRVEAARNLNINGKMLCRWIIAIGNMSPIEFEKNLNKVSGFI